MELNLNPFEILHFMVLSDSVNADSALVVASTQDCRFEAIVKASVEFPYQDHTLPRIPCHWAPVLTW